MPSQSLGRVDSFALSVPMRQALLDRPETTESTCGRWTPRVVGGVAVVGGVTSLVCLIVASIPGAMDPGGEMQALPARTDSSPVTLPWKVVVSAGGLIVSGLMLCGLKRCRDQGRVEVQRAPTSQVRELHRIASEQSASSLV
jgi:hypothetical protein